MTDKEKIISEIQRRINLFRKDGKLGSDTEIALYGLINFINGMQEEPVSEDLDEYINELSKQFPEVSFAKLSRISVRVAKWQKEQFEKNRLEHCNSITNEQAELEQKFLDEHLDKNNRMPTFLDAIEYGMRLQKERMMTGAILETEVQRDSDGDGVETPYESWLTLANTEIPELPENLGLKEGDRAKILIIKSE